MINPKEQNGVTQAPQSNRSRILTRVIGATALVLVSMSKAHAAAGDFDATASIAVLAACIAGVAAIVGGIVALSGGMDVYKKVRGFFLRAK